MHIEQTTHTIAVVLIFVPLTLQGCGASLAFPAMTAEDRQSVHDAASIDARVSAEARKRTINNHPEWSELTREAIRNGEAVPGMTPHQVLAAWGDGLCIRQAAGGGFFNGAVRERWVYCRQSIIILAHFREEQYVDAIAYDQSSKRVDLVAGTFGLRLPPKSSAESGADCPSDFLKRVQQVEPEY